jgi:hypothetical protein
MQTAAIFVSIFASLSIAIFLPLVLSGDRSNAAQETARGRRLAEAKMNARLLRLNL